jgi:hypothetical protein
LQEGMLASGRLRGLNCSLKLACWLGLADAQALPCGVEV